MNVVGDVRQFIERSIGLDPSAIRDCFFSLIGLEPRSIDAASARHAEYMLTSAGVTGSEPQTASEQLIAGYLGPEAAYYGCVDRARELVDSITAPKLRAEGYRGIFGYSQARTDLDRCMTSVEAGLRAATVPSGTAGYVAIIAEMYAAAMYYKWSDAAENARQLTPPEQIGDLKTEASRFRAKRDSVHARHLRDVEAGYW